MNQPSKVRPLSPSKDPSLPAQIRLGSNYLAKILAFCGLVALCSAGVAAQTGAQWTASGFLANARSSASVTVLSDGRALIAGGANSSGLVAQAEIFDPTVGTATPVGTMVVPRQHHVAVLLQDKRVLLVGGEGSSGMLASAEIFDPQTGSFISVGALTTARTYLTATVQDDGTVLIIGGENANGSVNTIEKFDPASGSFTTLSVTLLTARAQHTSTLLTDGRIFIAGGRTGTTALSSTEYLDPKALTETAGPTLAQARYAHTADRLFFGRVVLTGGWDGTNIGNTAEVLFPDGTLEAGANTMQVGRYDHTSVVLPDNQNLLILGGKSAGGAVNTVEYLDPVTFKTSAAPSMLNARAEFGALASNGNAYALGGNDPSNVPQASTESYQYPTIKPDKSDYPPNSTVTLTGSGWTPGETVQITIHESDNDPDTALSAVADSQGQITNSQFSTLQHDGGTYFVVTATGGVSQRTAYTSFLDSHFISSVSPASVVTTFSDVDVKILGGNFIFSNQFFNGSCPPTVIQGQIVAVIISKGRVSTKLSYTVVSSGEIDATIPGSIALLQGTYTIDVVQQVSGRGFQSFCFLSICICLPSPLPTTLNDAYVNFTVTSAAIAATTLSVPAVSGTFGGSVNLSATLTRTADNSPVSGKTVSFTLSGTNVGSAVTDSSGTASLSNISLAGIGANTYPAGIQASFAGDANFQGSSGTGQLTVNRANAKIVVTPYSVTYDGNAHTATGTATGVNSESLSGLDLSGTTHTNAGTYGIDAWTFTDSTGNYNNTSGLVFDSIAKANAKIVVTPYNVTYDGNAHTATGTATGVKGETLSGLNLSGTTHTNAGTYGIDAWTFTDSTDNYNNVSVSQLVFDSITPAPLSVVANNASRGYGQPNPLFGPSYIGFVNGENASVLAGRLTCSSPATPSSPVAGSPYAITCSGLTSSNYAITYVAGALTVTAAPLTITANGATKILDAPLPAFGASYSGFVNGEGPSVLTGSLSCTTTATATSPVGSYPITCSGLTAANYAISWTAGTLKVMYAPAGVCGHVILPPIDPAGTTVGNQGRTIPAKFQVCDANGVSIGTPGVVTGFLLTQIITGTATANVEDIVDTNNPDTAFRWDGTEWIFNITTQSLAAGSTYVYTIMLNDGSIIVFQFGLR